MPPSFRMNHRMHRTAILGAFLMLVAPLAPLEIPGFVDRLTLKAELDHLAGGIDGLSAAAIHVDPSHGKIVVRGLVLRQPDLSLRIGRLAFDISAQPLVIGAGLTEAAAATRPISKAPVAPTPASVTKTGTISADDIHIESGALHATIKHIDLQGTKLTKAELDTLFDPHAPGTPAERLAKITAAHVAISGIVLTTSQPATETGKASGGPTGTSGDKDAARWDEKIALSDITADDVVQGRAAHAAIGATSTSIHSPDEGDVQIALGPTQARGLDLAQVARLLSATSDAAGVQQKLCDSLAIQGVKLSAPKADIGFTALTIKDVKSGSLQSLLASSDHLKTDGPPAERADALAHLLQNIDIGGLEFADLRFSTTNETTPLTGRINHGVMTQTHAPETTDANFDGLTFAEEGTTLTVGHLHWHDTAATENTAEKVLPNKIGPPEEAAPRAEEQKVAADTLDLSLGPRQARAGIPTHFQLAHFDAVGSKSASGTPVRMQASFDHLVFAIDGSKGSDFAPMAALGYDKLDLSSQLSAHFDENSNEFGLDGLSVSGADIGSVRLSGRLDHVTKALFSTDQIDMETGFLSLLLHSIEIKVVNAGLFDRLVASAAKKGNVTPAQIRTNYIDAVKQQVPKLLNNGRGTDAIVAALVKFISDPKNLRLAATAPKGIAAIQLVLIQDPAVLLQKLDIEAAADE